MHLKVRGVYARRYDRCAEYLDIVRQTWRAAAPFDYQGDYFQLREAWSPAQPLAHGSIGLSFAGTSEEALDLSARYADLHMLGGEPLAETAQKIAALQQRAAAHGRQLQFSISQRAIVEDSEKLAWEKAEHLYQQALKQLGPKADQPADFKLDMQQSASARQLIANRLKNDYNGCHDMRQKSIASCYQNNVAWL